MTDHILVHRAVLQAAVDALEELNGMGASRGLYKGITSFADLCALLDDPCEPVAWMVSNGVHPCGFFRDKRQAEIFAADEQKCHALSGSLAFYHVKELYTTNGVGKTSNSENLKILKELEELEPALEALVNYINNFSSHCNSDEVIKAEAALERLYKKRKEQL